MNTTRNVTRRESHGGRPFNATKKEIKGWKHRVVDPLKDESVWATVDDACNSCCHGSVWRENAEDKWKKKGFKCYLKDARSHMFGGICNGSTQSGGKSRMPYAMQLVESLQNLPGVIGSHEITDKDHPLLLSQKAQAKFGFIKNMRRGTIVCEDHDHQNLEVVRQKGTGLFMIRIDHLDLGEYLEFARKSESARSVIDKGSDAYVDAYIDWIELEETTSTSNDLRWPIPHRSNVDEIVARVISHNYGCEYCGRWYPQSPFPSPNCNHCGARPSDHHERCCPMRPRSASEDEESVNEGAEQGVTFTLWTMPTISPYPRIAFVARKETKQDKKSVFISFTTAEE